MEQVNETPCEYGPDWEWREDQLILGEIVGSGAFGQVVKAETIGMLAFNPRGMTSAATERCSKLQRSTESKMKHQSGNLNIPKTTVAVKMLKGLSAQRQASHVLLDLQCSIYLNFRAFPFLASAGY